MWSVVGRDVVTRCWLYCDYLRGAQSLHLVRTSIGKLAELGFCWSYWSWRCEGTVRFVMWRYCEVCDVKVLWGLWCEGTVRFVMSRVLTVVPLGYFFFRHVKIVLILALPDIYTTTPTSLATSGTNGHKESPPEHGQPWPLTLVSLKFPNFFLIQPT